MHQAPMPAISTPMQIPGTAFFNLRMIRFRRLPLFIVLLILALIAFRRSSSV